jgi:hypothetical protein
MTDLFKLHQKPILKPLAEIYGYPIKTTDQKVSVIQDIIKKLRLEGNYYYPLVEKDRLKIPSNFENFINFLKSKYKTEKQETFTHPYWFNKFGGDCDCQTIYFLSHLDFLPDFVRKSNVEILILSNFSGGRRFYHITQSFDANIIDCLPYPIPIGTKLEKKFNLRGI